MFEYRKIKIDEAVIEKDKVVYRDAITIGQVEFKDGKPIAVTDVDGIPPVETEDELRQILKEILDKPVVEIENGH